MSSESDDKTKNTDNKPQNFFERMAEKLETTVNSTANKIEEGLNQFQQNYKNKEGFAGEISDVVDKTVAKGKEINQKIKDKGGLTKAVKECYDKSAAAAEAKYKDLENKICTNGVYDPEKAKIVFNDTSEVIKTYGRQGGEYLIRLSIKVSRKIGDTVLPNWTTIRPSQQDLQEGGKYYGLGSKHTGSLLFTENYENTVKFREKAKEAIPDNKGFGRKDEILNDIWVSASANASDLLRYYNKTKSLDKVGSIIAKSSVVTKYLAK